MAFSTKNILRFIGLDKSVAYSSGARIFQAVAGAGSILFISAFLTGVEQGYFFTFYSIMGLQLFFELGITGILTQYVAHEASQLTINNQNVYEGNQTNISRLASLVRFSYKWFLYASIGLLITLIIIGFIYFYIFDKSENENIDWQMPWIILCISAAIKLFQSPFTAIFNGLGYVKEMSKIMFYQQLIQPLVMWLGLVFGLKLYVQGMGFLASVILWQIFVSRSSLGQILKNLFHTAITERVEYMKEIFPYQWRIGLSWISGYLLFQLFTPVLFATEGAVVAGQMGMTMTALSAIQSLSYSWLHTKVPTYSKLIALKNYVELDKIFNKTMWQMAGVCCTLLAIFYLAVTGLKVTGFALGSSVLGDRFLDYIPMFLMMIPVIQQQFMYSWATYLRCHKQEPFLWNSVVGGVAGMMSTVGFGYLFGVYGVSAGYAAIALALMPWGYHIYKTKKQLWHNG